MKPEPTIAPESVQQMTVPSALSPQGQLPPTLTVLKVPPGFAQVPQQAIVLSVFSAQAPW